VVLLLGSQYTAGQSGHTLLPRYNACMKCWVHTAEVSNLVKQGPSDANSRSASLEPEDSLPCSQGPATEEPDKLMSVHMLPHYSFKIHLTTTFHLRLGLIKGIDPSGFPTKILYVSHACYMPRPRPCVTLCNIVALCGEDFTAGGPPLLAIRDSV
jgi:hypothetical protein